MYVGESNNDDLNEFIDFPMIYSKDKFVLLFDKSILNLPILMANSQLLSTVENIINLFRKEVPTHLYHFLFESNYYKICR